MALNFTKWFIKCFDQQCFCSTLAESWMYHKIWQLIFVFSFFFVYLLCGKKGETMMRKHHRKYLFIRNWLSFYFKWWHRLHQLFQLHFEFNHDFLQIAFDITLTTALVKLLTVTLRLNTETQGQQIKQQVLMKKLW